MLPLRIDLQGFLTYRDRTILDFCRDWLWAITGKNGAGKSAIFDGITFALYGQHRGGDQHDEQLISQGADFLRVAFDFAVGPNAYRVERTITRRARRRGSSGAASYAKTTQAYTIDSTEPDPTRADPVPNTDRVAGLEEWVRRTVGLDYEAFVSSVLLKQGEAERFLMAKPRERKDILIELLNLAPYVRLEEVAKRHRRDRAEELLRLDKLLEPLAGATPEAIRTAEDRRDTLGGRLAQLRDALTRASLTLENARRHARLAKDLTDTRTRLTTVLATLGAAEMIERDFAELGRLEAALPDLQAIVGYRAKASQAEKAASELRRAAGEIDVAGLEVRSRELIALETSAEQAYVSGREATAIARRAAEAVSPLAETGREVARLNREIFEAGTELERLCPALAERPAVEERYRACDEADRAIGYLRELRQQRQELAAVRGQLPGAEARLRALRQSTEDLRRQCEDLRNRAGQAAEETQRTREALAERRSDLSKIDEDLRQRRAAQAEGRCSRCGQLVDAAHIQREIGEAEERAQSLRETVQGLARQANAGESAAKQLLSQAAAVEQQARTTEAEANKVERQIGVLRQRRETAERQIERTILGLPELYREEAEPEAYPTEARLAEVQRLASGLIAARARRDELAALAGKAGSFQGRIQQAQQSIVDLQACYPDEDLAAAVERHASLSREASRLAELEECAAEAWRAARERARVAREAHESAARRQRELLDQASHRDGEAKSARSALAALVDRAKPVWPDAESVTQSDLATLRIRATQLAPARERKATLEEARNSRGALEARVGTLVEEIGQIPEADRISEVEAERRLATTRREVAEREDEYHQAAVAATTLAQQLRKRQEFLRQRDEVRTAHADYDTLARHFGKDGLQSWLVQAAQETIGHSANDFLARISEGWLQLKMEPKGEDLEILVTDLSSGQEAMDAAFISGSQQFRAAVALALAVGQYSGGGSRQIRSVIIDEGFGSLDEDGRREMIGQLKGLSGVLDRVILVSHQEAFQDAFPNGYHVEKQDGISHVSLRSGER